MDTDDSFQVPEFVDTVKRWAPAKRRQLEQWLNIKVSDICMTHSLITKKDWHAGLNA